MRLSDFEIDAIRKTVSQTFGPAVSVWLFGSRVDDSKRGGDLDLLIVAESDQIRIDVLKKETDFLVALKQLIGEQKIDLIAATPESLASDPFLLSLSARIPLMGTHAIKITPELIETSHLFLKTHNINRNAAPLNDYLIYSDGRVVALVEIAKTTVAGDASTADPKRTKVLKEKKPYTHSIKTLLTQKSDQADQFKSLVLAELRKTLPTW